MAARYQNISTGGGNSTFLRSLPLLLLLLALSTVFLFGNDRGRFYRLGLHSGVSANHLSVAANLSPEHNFLLFYHQTLDEEGAPDYVPYSRFPIGGYALIKLVTLPFGNDFSAQLYAVRMMFLLFFAGSAALAYLSLRRLTDNRWIALAAALLAFSSYYLLYYNDMTATENGLSLFGVLLTFHGMVLFVQEGRFRQLLVKACIALLLGWHVYALLLPFIVLGIVIELNRARLSVPPSLAGQIKSCAAALLFSRYLTLGVVTLLFGMAVLAFNLGTEYRAFDGEVPLTELPTVKSITYRVGADEGFSERYAETLEWGNFLPNQFYRITGATLPFIINPFDHDIWGYDDYRGVIVGALASGLAVIGLLFARRRMLLATLLIAGFCWALLMRNNTAFHDFESVFYIGVPLVLFSIGLLRLRGLFGGHLIVGLSAAALLVFVLSSFQMGRVGHDRQASEFQEAVVADFEHIRTIAEPGQSVSVPQPVWGLLDSYQFARARALPYYLAGRVIGTPRDSFAYDFLISRQRVDVPALLTPENRQIFLYRQGDYDYSGLIDEMIRQSELVIRGDDYFDVYRSGNKLIYVGNQSEDRATQFTFFLHLTPVDVEDLPDHRKQYGFDNLDFHFDDYKLPLTERPIAVRELPPYDIASIRTGQYVPVEGGFNNIWGEEIRLEQ